MTKKQKSEQEKFYGSLNLLINAFLWGLGIFGIIFLFLLLIEIIDFVDIEFESIVWGVMWIAGLYYLIRYFSSKRK